MKFNWAFSLVFFELLIKVWYQFPATFCFPFSLSLLLLIIMWFLYCKLRWNRYPLHRYANKGFVFVVGKRKIISGVIFDVESESGIRISLSRQNFEIFEVMCSKSRVFRYFWGYVKGARNFFVFFLKCHHLALLFPFKMSYWTVTSDFFHKDTAISSFDIYPNNLMSIHIDSGAYHSAFENLSWEFVLAGFDGLWIRIYSQKIDIRERNRLIS